MKLARAQDEAEKITLEEEMKAEPETRAILDALHATRASARDRQKLLEGKIRQEAKGLAP